LLPTVRKTRELFVCQVLQADALEELHGVLAQLLFRLVLERKAQDATEHGERVAVLEVATKHDVLENRHRRDQREVLEGTSNAHGGDLVGCLSEHFLTAVADASTLGLVHTTDD